MRALRATLTGVTGRTTWRQDVFDAASTFVLAVAVALWLRSRQEPLDLPAFSPLVPFIGGGLIRSPRLRRLWVVSSMGLMAGVIVSMPWIR
jgi:hypothetical protein